MRLGYITTYPERRKGHYAFPYCGFGAPIPLLKVLMDPGIGLSPSCPCPTMHKNLPSNDIRYAGL